MDTIKKGDGHYTRGDEQYTMGDGHYTRGGEGQYTGNTECVNSDKRYLIRGGVSGPPLRIFAIY